MAHDCIISIVQTLKFSLPLHSVSLNTCLFSGVEANGENKDILSPNQSLCLSLHIFFAIHKHW